MLKAFACTTGICSSQAGMSSPGIRSPYAAAALLMCHIVCYGVRR